MSLIEIKKSLESMITPGDVVELRIFDQNDKKYCGWFTDIDKMAEAAISHDDTAEGTYYTCNACMPDMIGVANNRIMPCRVASSEKNMLRRRIIGIDIDPRRNPVKISSTDEEHNLAIEKAREIKDWLKAQGWGDPVLGDSGNGAHLDYFVNLPVTENIKILYKKLFEFLKLKFSSDKVDVQGFEDANRVWKLYGTMVRKGENLPNRPHRKSSIIEVPKERVLVTLEQIKTIADMLPKDEPKEQSQNNDKTHGKVWNPWKLKQWLGKYNIEIARTKTESDKTYFILKACMFNPDHAGNKEAEVHIDTNGVIGYKCHHDSCKGKRWVDARELFEPNYKDKWQKNSNEAKTCGDCLFKPREGVGSCRNPENEDKEKKQKKQVVYDDAACDKFKDKQTTIKTPNNHAGAYLSKIPIENIENNPLSIDELTNEFKQSIYVDEDINIKLPFVFAVSSFTPVDPDCMVIVGASGSGKTEEIRALGDTENQYIYPISSLTSHTFITGLKDAPDLAPTLKNRLVTIKDFTTILSKNKDEVSGIFADVRDVMDGYLTKTYGSGVGKKEYRNLHSSFLIACTNAIEGYYSLCSVLGQRLVYFRPLNDPRESRKQALKNAGNEKVIREKHHALTMRFLNTVFSSQKDRLQNITQAVPDDMKERIGKLCEFLAIARTHINRDMKGNMACLPEPELPTRLTKTLVKLVDAYSIVHDRLPDYQDEAIALRLIHDNLPTERIAILKVMACFDEPKKTSEIATSAKTPTAMTNRVLNDLATLGIITRYDKESMDTNADSWDFSEGEFKNAFLIVTNPEIWSIYTEMLKGVNRLGIGVKFNDELIRNVHDFFIKEKKDINKQYIEKVIKTMHIHLTEIQPASLKVESKQAGTPQSTELSISLEKARTHWEQEFGTINSANLTRFVMRYCETLKPKWEHNGESGYYKPSAIQGIAAKLFKITPEPGVSA